MFNINPGKNIIINPIMEIDQIGSQVPNPGSPIVDRFTYGKNDVGSPLTYSTGNFVDSPTVSESGIYSKNCLILLQGTPDDSPSASQFVDIHYSIEGYDFSQIYQKPMVLSFWVKATLTGIYSICLQSGGSDRFWISEYTINTTNTWEKKVIKIDAAPSSGTWDFTNDVGVYIRWVLVSGSDYKTSSLTQWISSPFFASTNQVNGGQTGATDFRLTQVKLEVGTIATALETRPFARELALCKRYYEKSYLLAIAPGTVTSVNQSTHFIPNAMTSRKQEMRIDFEVEKRASPSTVTIYSPVTGTAGQFYNTGTSTDVAATVEYKGTKQFSIYGTFAASDATDMRAHWVAFSEFF